MIEPDTFPVTRATAHRGLDAWLQMVHDMEADPRPARPPPLLDGESRGTPVDAAALRARYAFAYRFAALVCELLDRTAEERIGAQFQFVVDMGAQVLAFTLAAARDSNEEGPNLDRASAAFLRALMTGYYSAMARMPVDAPEAGHA